MGGWLRWIELWITFAGNMKLRFRNSFRRSPFYQTVDLQFFKPSQEYHKRERINLLSFLTVASRAFSVKLLLYYEFSILHEERNSFRKRRKKKVTFNKFQNNY